MILLRTGVATRKFGRFGRTLRAGAIPPAFIPCMEGNLSVQAISWVLDHSQSRGLSRLVLISIANHADKFGREAFPAVKTIAGEAGVSEREVQYCIRELSQLGEVEVDYKASKYGTNIYALAKMHPANCAPPPCTPCRETAQAPGKESPPTPHTLAPEPSLTVQRDDAPSAPTSIDFKSLNQLLDDWHARRWKTDERGRRYLITPASPHRKVYESEMR